jgi:hypothetical protein
VHRPTYSSADERHVTRRTARRCARRDRQGRPPCAP